MRAALAAALLVSGAAAAQDVNGRVSYIAPDEIARFQLCRAAVFYHLDGEADPRSTVPRPVARTLLDQITFIMGESLILGQPGTVDNGQAVVRVAESFFLGFSRILAAERENLSDPARRDAILNECAPWIWSTARLFIDDLAAWRRSMVPAPPPRTSEESQSRRDAVLRRLVGEE